MAAAPQGQGQGLAGLTASRYGATPAVKFSGAADKSIVKPEDVPAAVAKLRKAFNADKTLPYEYRISQLKALLRVCEEEGEELRQALFKDLHKSALESNLTEIDLVAHEIHYAINHLHEWMQPTSVNLTALNQPGTGHIYYDPLGVALVMGAWNYPVQLTLAPMVGAIAAGNCVAVKPASYAPNVSHALGKALAKHMDPDTCVVFEGDRHVTDALLKQRFDHIFFTGSGYVGRIVAKAAAEFLTPVVLELGGKSPCIVDKSASLEMAAERLMWGSFLNSGQTCIRPDHCLVHADVADKFIALCKQKLTQFYSSDPQKTEWFGRVINDNAMDRLAALVDASKAQIVHGGRYDKKDKFLEPTLVDYGTNLDAFDAAPAMQDEIFGPILPIGRFTDLERDVIQRVRRLPTGKPLALYLFADDKQVQEEVLRRTSSGGVCVNDCLMHLVSPETPFGGVGNSGMGSYHGLKSFQTFSHSKSTVKKYSALDAAPIIKDVLAVRFPPYTAQKQSLLKILGNPAADAVGEFFQKPMVQRVLMALFGAWLFRRLGLSVTMAKY